MVRCTVHSIAGIIQRRTILHVRVKQARARHAASLRPVACNALAGLSLPRVAFAANNVSPQDFDMACAITTGAEMGSNPPNSEKRGAAFTLLVSTLGV